MLRFLIPLASTGLFLVAVYLLWKGVKQAIGTIHKVEFVYVRFRDGILVLKKQSRFGEEEIQFKAGQAWDDLAPKQLAATTAGINWFHFPSGHEVMVASEEEKAIQRCLRFANNTGLLQAEAATE